jgi:LPXTG-motif cell wall-anchored protein
MAIRMPKLRRVLVVTLGVSLVALMASASTAGAQGRTATVTLSPENNSGITGTATLTDMGNGETQVVVRITPTSGDHPAHIHSGNCGPTLGGVVYPLTNVQNGTSTTVVGTSLADVQTGGFAINLHESPTNIPLYVACGNIQAAAQVGGGGGGAAQVPRALPRTGDLGSMAPLAAAVGSGLLGFGLVLRRRIHR